MYRPFHFELCFWKARFFCLGWILNKDITAFQIKEKKWRFRSWKEVKNWIGDRWWGARIEENFCKNWEIGQKELTCRCYARISPTWIHPKFNWFDRRWQNPIMFALRGPLYVFRARNWRKTLFASNQVKTWFLWRRLEINKLGWAHRDSQTVSMAFWM